MEKRHWKKEERPDLVILDILMPEMDGWDVLERIESNPDLSGIPVIMLTARVSDEDVLRVAGDGAVEYMTKPYLKICGSS